jgi:peptidoglycan/LPS O-acetylase OafA/YrhL
MNFHSIGKAMRATEFGVLNYGAWRTTLGDRLVATSFRGPGFGQVRLVAATVVVLHHCRSVEHDVQVDPLFTYSGGFFHFGLLAVLIFFAVSGFLVTPGLARSGNLIDYATHRALRIFPALTVVVIASMVVLGPVLTTLSPAVYYSDPRVYFYGKNILTLTYDYLPGVVSRGGQPAIINGALWTLHFEILSYIALAIMSLAGVLRKPCAILVVFLATYGLYVAVGFEPGILRVLPGRFVTFVNLFVYFAAGAALYMFRSRIPYSTTLAALALALLTVALPFGFGAVVAPLCLPYITIFAGLSVLPGRSLVKKDLSYGIYLIHAPILVGFSLLYPGVLRWWMVAVVVFFITLMLSYLSWTFVEAPALARKKAVSNWTSDRLNRMKFA